MKLFGQGRRMFTMMTGILVFSLLLAACGSSNTGSSSTTPTMVLVLGPNGKGCMKVGVLLPETATSARWDNKDRPLLQADIPQAASWRDCTLQQCPG